MRDLVDTTEMYLRTIYELEEEGIPPLRARIAERLEQSGPTVSQTVARMERDGLLTVSKDRSLRLSVEGRTRATSVMRKHRLAERLLTDVIGLPWEKVHDEACRWEHVMGDEVEMRLLKVLDTFDTSPFGNPIPGMKALLAEAPEDQKDDIEQVILKHAADDSVRASDIDTTYAVEVIISSFNEIVQVEHKIMAKFASLDIGPGRPATIETNDKGLEIRNDNGAMTIPDDLGHAIRVRIVR